jgi:hypothetical protein
MRLTCCFVVKHQHEVGFFSDLSVRKRIDLISFANANATSGSSMVIAISVNNVAFLQNKFEGSTVKSYAF